MQTEVLEEFLAVAKHSSFRKAADEIHITQPALSKHIAALEREIGFKLFERGSTTRLTPAGEYFYGLAQHVLEELRGGVEKGKDIAAQTQPVRLQMLGQEDSALYPQLKSVKTPYRIVPMSTDQPIFAALDAGEADLLAAPGVPELINQNGDVRRRDYLYFPIGRAEVTHLVSSKSELAGKDSLSVEDLRDAEVLLPFGCLFDYFSYVAPGYTDENIGQSFVQDPTMPMSANRIPLGDLGQRVMVCYRGAAHSSCQGRSDVVAIDKMDGKSFETEEYLVWRADNANPKVRAFADEVRRLVEDSQGEA